MASALSFFDYKKAVLNKGRIGDKGSFSDLNLPAVFEPIFADKNDTDFYRLSFYHRNSLEQEYQLLGMLVRLDERFPVEYKRQAEHYLESCAHFLLRDAQIADNSAEAKKYQDKIDEFAKTRVAAEQPQVRPASLSEWQKSLNRFYKDMNDYLSTPWHISKFITLLSYINLYRLLTAFSRLFVKNFWNFASERGWIDFQDKLFGFSLQRPALEYPVAILNFLSVALFILRLTCHVAMILKHGLSERAGEKDISQWDRMAREVSTRMTDLFNDGAWWWVNLLTNYSDKFPVIAPYAAPLLAAALVYDCTWVAIHWYRKERDWGRKKAELENWLENHSSTDAGDIAITRLQLELLNDTLWEIRYKYLFSIAAGLFIMTSVLLFLAAISTLVTTVSLLVCVAGFAMYGSADEFAGWMRAKYCALKNANDEAEMRAKFINNFTQAIGSPLLVMGLMAFSWQVAMVVAVGVFLFPYVPAKLDLGGDVQEEAPQLGGMQLRTI